MPNIWLAVYGSVLWITILGNDLQQKKKQKKEKYKSSAFAGFYTCTDVYNDAEHKNFFFFLVIYKKFQNLFIIGALKFPPKTEECKWLPL